MMRCRNEGLKPGVVVEKLYTRLSVELPENYVTHCDIFGWYPKRCQWEMMII